MMLSTSTPHLSCCGPGGRAPVDRSPGVLPWSNKVWNTRVDSLSVDPSSATDGRTIGATRRRKADFGSEFGRATRAEGAIAGFAVRPDGF